MNDMENTMGISPNAHTPNEMDCILKERVQRAEAGEEKIIPHQNVVDFISEKYGFEPGTGDISQAVV